MKRFLLFTLSALALAMQSALLFSQGARWNSFGPEGGTIHALYRTGTTVIAGARSGGIFRSTDEGRSWSGPEIPGTYVFDFAGRGDTVFAATNRMTFLTTDGGSSWTGIGPSIQAPFAQVQTAYFTESGIILAGTEWHGVFRSTDMGLSWSGPALEGIRISSIISGSDGTLYCGTWEGVYVSTDDGARWERPGLNDVFANALCIDESGRIYAGGNGVYRSSDRGAVWEKLIDRLESNVVWTMARSANGSLFFGSGNGAYRSEDEGNTWMLVFPDTSRMPYQDVFSLAFDSHDRLIVGTWQGVFIQDDSGWVQRNTGLTATEVYHLFKASDGTIYAAQLGNSIAASTDGGRSWSDIGWYGQAFDIAEANDGTLFVAGEKYKMKRKGSTEWETLPDPRPIADPRSILLTSNHTLLAGLTYDGIYRSTNFGETWELAATNTHATWRFIQLKSGTLLAGGSIGIDRSTDDGVSWQPIAGLPQSNFRSFVETSDGKVFAACESGGSDFAVYLSTDDGKTWSASGPASVDGYSVALSHQGILYLGTYEHGVYSSTDLGRTWTRSDNQPANENVMSLLALPDNTLLAGTLSNGVYRTSQTTTRIDPGSAAAQPVSFIDISPQPIIRSGEIRFRTDGGRVRLQLFDLTGRAVHTPIDKELSTGEHTFPLLASSLPSGLYICRLSRGEYSVLRSLTVVR